MTAEPQPRRQALARSRLGGGPRCSALRVRGTLGGRHGSGDQPSLRRAETWRPWVLRPPSSGGRRMEKGRLPTALGGSRSARRPQPPSDSGRAPRLGRKAPSGAAPGVAERETGRGAEPGTGMQGEPKGTGRGRASRSRAWAAARTLASRTDLGKAPIPRPAGPALSRESGRRLGL